MGAHSKPATRAGSRLWSYTVLEESPPRADFDWCFLPDYAAPDFSPGCPSFSYNPPAMKRALAIASSVLTLTVTMALFGAPAFATEVREGDAPNVAITLPADWTVAQDGAWSLADAPDHRAHLRLLSSATGLLADGQAEAFLVNLIAETWGTYTVDRHVRHVACGRLVGIELLGHGAGDSWDRAKFHLFLLVDPGAPQRSAIVLLSGKDDAWDTYHPVLERAVHALH